jgi:hypothetical protein
MHIFNIHIHVHIAPSDFYPAAKRNGDATPLYSVYKCMKERCTSPKHTAYPRYGGRGVTICSEWVNDFQAFAKWARANGFQHGLDIDRINNDGNYEPNNCRFITRAENNKNRTKGPDTNFGKHMRKPVLCIETGEEYASILVAAKALSVSYQAVANAIKRNGTCGGLTFKFK